MRKLVLAAAVLCLAATPLLAQTAPPSPRGAWIAMQKEIAEALARRDRAGAREVEAKRTSDFLEAWDKSGGTAEGQDLLYLGRFYGVARRPLMALDAFRACAADPNLPADIRGQARGSFGRTTLAAITTEKVTGEDATRLIEEATGMLSDLKGPEMATYRADLHRSLALIHDRGHRKALAVKHYLAAAEDQPSLAYTVARSALPALMYGVCRMEDYPALSERGHAMLARLAELYGIWVKTLPPEEAERRASGVERIREMGMALDLLGKPAPEWTLIRAYGGTKAIADHRGKVVFVDFWATWCGWCIKSFPAVRELLRDYAGKDLVIVGVTTPANYVTSANYGLDDDLSEKAKTAPAPTRLRFPARGTDEEKAAFRKKEQEVLAEFIKNHEMTWDVVLIDPEEPAAKYALTGWPHAMVLDRQGRIRYFKRGALLKDREMDVAGFRKVLDTLLAEKAD